MKMKIDIDTLKTLAVLVLLEGLLTSVDHYLPHKPLIIGGLFVYSTAIWMAAAIAISTVAVIVARKKHEAATMLFCAVVGRVIGWLSIQYAYLLPHRHFGPVYMRVLLAVTIVAIAIAARNGNGGWRTVSLTCMGAGFHIPLGEYAVDGLHGVKYGQGLRLFAESIPRPSTLLYLECAAFLAAAYALMAAKRSSDEVWTATVVGCTTIMLHGSLAVVAAFVLMPQETGFGLEFIEMQVILTLTAMMVSSWLLGGMMMAYVKRIKRKNRNLHPDPH